MGQRVVSVEKVLLVDDWQPQLNQWSRDCRALGKTPLPASTRADAIHIAKRERPELALVDVLLDSDDGIRVTRALKEIDAHLVVVLVTGQLTVEVGLLGIEAGAKDCYSKVVRGRSIIEAIELGRRAAPARGERLDLDEEKWERIACVVARRDTMWLSALERSTKPTSRAADSGNMSPHASSVTDFYRRLLDFGFTRDARAAVNDAVRLLVKITRGSSCLVELQSAPDPAPQFRCEWQDDTGPLFDFERAERLVTRHVNQQASRSATTGQTVGRVSLKGMRLGAFESELLDLFARQLALVVEQLAPVPPMTLPEEVNAFKERRIHEALQRSGGNVSEAARRLDISRAHVYEVLRRRQ